MALLREGIKVVPPTQSLFSLYQAAGEILARDGKLEDAVALLLEGIKVVPPTQSLFSLYQAAGEILARDGKLEDAVALLREGIKVVPPTQNLFSLYQAACEILARDGKLEDAVASLREGRKRIGDASNGYKLAESAILTALDFGRFDLLHEFPMGQAQQLLLQILTRYHAGDYEAGIEAAERGINAQPRYFVLYMQGTIAALAAREVKRARGIFSRWPAELQFAQGESATWLHACPVDAYTPPPPRGSVCL